MRLSAIVLWAICITVAATIVLPFVLPLLPIHVPSGDIVLGLGVLTFLFLLGMLACAVAFENGRSPRLMRTGITAAILACIVWNLLIVVDPSMQIWISILRVLIWPTTWSGLMAVTGLLLLPRAHQTWWLWLRRVAIGTVAVLAAHITLAITFYPNTETYGYYVYQYEEVCARIGAALTIVAGAAVAMTLLGALMPRLGGPAPRDLVQLPYWLHCPRCRHEQHAITGMHHCSNCGLRVRVEVS